jgi:cytochrome c-type biogenesis protein CcmH
MSRARSPFVASLAAALLLAAPAVAGPDDSHAAAAPADFSVVVEGAAALEGRIRAPCCWNQTLDIHGSEVSTELRREIRRRLTAGETQEAIQADFVRRYGERILAVPPGNPLKDLGVLLSIAFGAAGVGAAFMVLRWRRRTLLSRAADEKAKKTKTAKRERDAWDDQIDSELERL